MGNIDALRDWGHAKDYVRMQWMMLQQEQPEDFVIATGVQYSVREFISGPPQSWASACVRGQRRGGDRTVEQVDGRMRACGQAGRCRHARSIHATSVPPRSRRFWAIPPKPKRSWAGSPRSPRKRCAPRWWPRICKAHAAPAVARERA